MNVAQVFGYSIPSACVPHIQVAGVTRAGIEIELENITDTNLNTNYWRSITDGSLRNRGREFVFNGAHGGTDLFLACVELDTFLGRQSPDGNWRCSTHVHVDVRELTATQLKNIIITNLVYEKLLFRLSGFQRYSNNFCSAFGFAQQQLQLLATNWNRDGAEFMNNVAGGWDKYSALNLRPLASFGSIEFRSSAAEWRKGKLIRLANRFLAIRDFGAGWTGSHEELIQHLASINPRDVMRKGIPPKDLPADWEEDISVGIKLAYDLLVFANQPVPELPTVEIGQVCSVGEHHIEITADNLSWMIERLRRVHNLDGIRNTSVRGSHVGIRMVNTKFVMDFCNLDGIAARDLLNEDNLRRYRNFVANQEDAPAPTIGTVSPSRFTLDEAPVFEVDEDEDDDDDGGWV